MVIFFQHSFNVDNFNLAKWVDGIRSAIFLQCSGVGARVIPVEFVFSYIPVKLTLKNELIVVCHTGPFKNGRWRAILSSWQYCYFSVFFPRWRYERSSAQCTVIHGVAYHLRYVAKQWHRQSEEWSETEMSESLNPQKSLTKICLRSVGAPDEQVFGGPRFWDILL